MLAFCLLTLAVSLLSGVIAVPTPSGSLKAVEQCDGGEVQCCLTVQDPKTLNWEAQLILGLVEADLGRTSGLIGTHCTGINALALEGSSQWCVGLTLYLLLRLHLAELPSKVTCRRSAARTPPSVSSLPVDECRL